MYRKAKDTSKPALSERGDEKARLSVSVLEGDLSDPSTKVDLSDQTTSQKHDEGLAPLNTDISQELHANTKQHPQLEKHAVRLVRSVC